MVQRAGAALASLSVAGFLALFGASFLPLHPCSLLEHFRLHLLVGGAVLVIAVGALALRARWLAAAWLDAALIGLLLEGLVVAPDLASARRPVGEGARMKILLANVLASGGGHAAVSRLIAEEQPDLIGLVEVNERWLRELAPALEGYAARIEHPRADNFGVALYARGTLAGGVEHLAVRVPAIIAEAEVGGARVAVALLHPVPPLDDALRRDQLAHFDAVAARMAARRAGPLVVMGDFNATPWSRSFARLRGATGTCDSRAGFGVQRSYPVDSWLVRIPIDHVLVSCDIGVRDRRLGPDVGSDHLPVIAELVVPL